METKISEIKELKIHGRTSENRSPLTLFWSASGFECNVSGSELWVEVEVSFDNAEPWFSYTINGDYVGRQMLQKGRYWIPLFRGMNPDKVKNVRFFRDLQAMSSDGNSLIQIHALRHDGSFSPVEDKKYKIEFIGDSITSGEGLFGAKEEEDWIPMFFSAIKSYTYRTARKLDADYRVLSQSGWGLYTSWDNHTDCVLPKYYRDICGLMQEEGAREAGADLPNDFAAWQPDVVVVNLGTNDAAAFDQPEWIDPATGIAHKMRKNADGSFCAEDLALFREAVAEFLTLLRACNPKAHIVWCYGMLGLLMEPSICEGIEKYRARTQDANVSYLRLVDTDDSNVGSRFHPGALCHEQSAEVLSTYLRDVLSK